MNPSNCQDLKASSCLTYGKWSRRYFGCICRQCADFAVICRLNTCPFQGSRTIRTEEAVLISLSQLSHPLAMSARSKEIQQEEKIEVQFSDESPSEESSSDGGADSGTSDEESGDE